MTSEDMKMIVRLYVFDNDSKFGIPYSVTEEITGYEVRKISDEEIQKMGFNEFDINHEYLILHYARFGWNEENGIGTYRNSRVEMEIVR